jgi:hypothetical protein
MRFAPYLFFFYPFSRTYKLTHSPFSGLAHGLWEILHALDMALRQMACGHIRAFSLSSLFVTQANDRRLHRYNSCDVGTFPNQMAKDKSGPPAVLRSKASNNKFSWLSGQRLS